MVIGEEITQVMVGVGIKMLIEVLNQGFNLEFIFHMIQEEQFEFIIDSILRTLSKGGRSDILSFLTSSDATYTLLTTHCHHQLFNAHKSVPLPMFLDVENRVAFLLRINH